MEDGKEIKREVNLKWIKAPSGNTYLCPVDALKKIRDQPTEQQLQGNGVMSFLETLRGDIMDSNKKTQDLAKQTFAKAAATHGCVKHTKDDVGRILDEMKSPEASSSPAP